MPFLVSLEEADEVLVGLQIDLNAYAVLAEDSDFYIFKGCR